MKSVIFIALLAVALVGLAACASGTTTGTLPTTAAQAAATVTVAIGKAPTLAPTETTRATPAATSAAGATTPVSAPTIEPNATSAATAEATSRATSAPTAPAGATAVAPTSPAGDVAPAQTFTVVGNEFKFDPNQLTLKAGQRVRIVFQNKGTVDHEFEVEDLEADSVVLDLSQAGNIPEDERDEAMGDAASGEVHGYAAANGTATIDFTPTTPGTYNFSCNLPGHKESGMTGTIVVQP